jgi:hypothetical protein
MTTIRLDINGDGQKEPVSTVTINGQGQITEINDRPNLVLSNVQRGTPIPRKFVFTGDSILHGGNNVQTGGTFVGSGFTGTITGVNAPVGSTIYITNAVQPEWNGPKTVATSAVGTITFTNPTQLTTNPTPIGGLSNIYISCDAQVNSRNVITIANGLLGLPFGTVINRVTFGDNCCKLFCCSA